MSGFFLPREFSLIDAYFRPLAGPAARNLADDAAVLDPPPGHQLVISADAMNENVHFLPGTDPALVARKLLRVNLSDLAAMGASPWGYLLTLAVPADTPETWFARFAGGLAQDQQEFGVALLGGDSTSIAGPASLSLTILGLVRQAGAIGRNGAIPGDAIFVTGTLGLGVLGLAVAQGKLTAEHPSWLRRHSLPDPRLGIAAGLAHAAIDISDGLFADLGHLCRAGHLTAEIASDTLPLASCGDPDWHHQILIGGDDYELLLAIPAQNEAALASTARTRNVPVTRIGHFSAGPPRILLDGQPMAPRGWSHFAQ